MSTTTATPAHYIELVRKVDHIVERYRDDLLVHDARAIKDRPECPFLHFANPSGTHLVFLTPHDDASWPKDDEPVPYMLGHADRWNILEQTHSLVDAILHQFRVQSIQYYDGTTLRNTTAHRVLDLVTDYIGETRFEWKHGVAS